MITVGSFDFPESGLLAEIYGQALAAHGFRMVAVLNKVSAHLDTGSLRAMDALMQLGGQAPRRVAATWLRMHGLVPKEPAVR